MCCVEFLLGERHHEPDIHSIRTRGGDWSVFRFRSTSSSSFLGWRVKEPHAHTPAYTYTRTDQFNTMNAASRVIRVRTTHKPCTVSRHFFSFVGVSSIPYGLRVFCFQSHRVPFGTTHTMHWTDGFWGRFDISGTRSVAFEAFSYDFINGNLIDFIPFATTTLRPSPSRRSNFGKMSSKYNYNSCWPLGVNCGDSTKTNRRQRRMAADKIQIGSEWFDRTIASNTKYSLRSSHRLLRSSLMRRLVHSNFTMQWMDRLMCDCMCQTETERPNMELTWLFFTWQRTETIIQIIGLSTNLLTLSTVPSPSHHTRKNKFFIHSVRRTIIYVALWLLLLLLMQHASCVREPERVCELISNKIRLNAFIVRNANEKLRLHLLYYLRWTFRCWNFINF